MCPFRPNSWSFVIIDSDTGRAGVFCTGLVWFITGAGSRHYVCFAPMGTTQIYIGDYYESGSIMACFL